MRPLLMGQCAGVIDDILPAKQIIEEMMKLAIETVKEVRGKLAKL